MNHCRLISKNVISCLPYDQFNCCHDFVICRHCNQICLENGKIKSKLHSRLSVSHFSIVNNNKCTSVISKLYNMNRAYLHVIVINLQYITTSRGHLKEEAKEISIHFREAVRSPF